MEEYRKIFSRNLQQYMHIFGLNQKEISEKMGVHKSVISSWINCTRYPRMNTIERLATLFNIEKSDLTDDKGKLVTLHTKGIKIPILGRVVAGIPIEAIENIEGYEEITPALASKGEHFALRVQGDSMAPVIVENDIVIVRKQRQVENGDIAIVLVNGDEATIKKVQINDHGITLVGFNIEVYPPHFYSEKEIATLPVQIIGKVVESKRSFL